MVELPRLDLISKIVVENLVNVRLGDDHFFNQLLL